MLAEIGRREGSHVKERLTTLKELGPRDTTNSLDTRRPLDLRGEYQIEIVW